MILYDERQILGLSDFGIEIPVSDSRGRKAFEALASHPVLGKEIGRWHMDRIETSLSREDLLRAHSGSYVERLFSDRVESELIRAFELMDEQGRYHRYNPKNAVVSLAGLFQRVLKEAGGTLQCCRTALETGFCFYFGGGMHHAQRDFGNGFCQIHDVVIAIRRLQAEKKIGTAWVIDLDAHKGDGTAALTREDPSIVTLSIHMAAGWPLDGQPADSQGNPNPSFIASDIDIPVARGEDHRYVSLLAEGLEKLDRFPPPDLCVVPAGADPYEADELPSAAQLKLTLEQLMERDRLVYRFLEKRAIPQAWLMAGGYGEASWQVYAQFLEWVLMERGGA